MARSQSLTGSVMSVPARRYAVTRRPAFDHARLAAALAAASGQSASAEALPFTSIAWFGGSVEFVAFGEFWRAYFSDIGVREPDGF